MRRVDHHSPTEAPVSKRLAATDTFSKPVETLSPGCRRRVDRVAAGVDKARQRRGSRSERQLVRHSVDNSLTSNSQAE